jgi:hypothetical protein
MSSREIARDVLLEALGSSATPFVPVPWVDDWIVARLLRRIAKKVLVRHGLEADKPTVKALADGFLGAGQEPLATRAAVGAVRFVVRKVAVVLDVKKSHDVFGEAIAFALALDAAVVGGALRTASPYEVGHLIHRAVSATGSAALEGLAGAVRSAFERQGAAHDRASNQTRAERVAEAVGARIDDAYARLRSSVQHELASWGR